MNGELPLWKELSSPLHVRLPLLYFSITYTIFLLLTQTLLNFTTIEGYVVFVFIGCVLIEVSYILLCCCICIANLIIVKYISGIWQYVVFVTISCFLATHLTVH